MNWSDFGEGFLVDIPLATLVEAPEPFSLEALELLHGWTPPGVYLLHAGTSAFAERTKWWFMDRASNGTDVFRMNLFYETHAHS